MRKRIIGMGSMLLIVILLVFVSGSVFAAPSDLLTNGNIINTTPVGPTSTDPGTTGAPNLDLQISGNSNSSSGGGEMSKEMSGEMSMMNSIMGMMGMDNANMNNNMNNMNGTNGMNGSTTNGVNPAVLTQLQSSNAMIMQLLNTLTSQPNNSNLQPQIQLLYQMLANQTALIQMLNSTSMNVGQSNMSGNSGGMSMM